MKWTNLILFVVTALLSCNKDAEIQPKEYPYVIAEKVEVYDNGAKFTADITNLGDHHILAHGFVWNDSVSPNINDHSKLINSEANTGKYTIELYSGFIEGQTYYVRPYIKTEKHEVYGNMVSFISKGSLPPVINDFSPKFGPIGTQVEIIGENFALSISGNLVKFGYAVAIIDSVFENKLIVRIPTISKPEKVNISIETAEMMSISNELFDLWFPWKEKNGKPQINNNATSFSINNKGYIINENTTNMIVYDPLNDSWQAELVLPENSGVLPLAYTSNNFVYVLLQNSFWQYNPKTETWTKKADFPGIRQTRKDYVIGMSINDNIYLGNCYNYYDFWEYDVVLDKWNRKGDFIGRIDSDNPVWGNFSFSINNKGFVGIGRSAYFHSFWEYDPIIDSWTIKSKPPTNSYDSFCSFVINNKGYVGLGHNFEWGDGYVSNEIWEYDLTADIWIKYNNCPIGMAVYTSFSMDNKGYVVPSYTRHYDKLYNIWEFNPSKN